MNIPIRVIHIFIILFFCSLSWAQEGNTDAKEYLNSLKTKASNKEVKISGQLSSSARSNYIFGSDRKVDPFNMRMNARLLVSAFGLNTSVNFNFGQGGRYYSLNLPRVDLPNFTRIGISPRYKWMKLHLGYRSMNFSKYTLGGHSYLGTGLDLTPGNFNISAMYGRLRRATAEDLLLQQNLDPSYKRMGWGLKAGYKKDHQEIALILFSAFDDPNSIPNPVQRRDVLPAENTVLSVIAKRKFGDRINLKLDYALSAFTRDVRSQEIFEQDGINYWEKMGGLFSPKVSSGYHKALHTEIGIRVGFGSISLQHERVDPDYRSLGSLFFQNDFENFTAGLNTALFKNKLRFSSRLGWERNNISAAEKNSLNRIIASTQFNYQYNEELGFALAYSNFRTTNKIRSTELPIPGLVDSVFLALVNQSLNLSFNLFKGEEKTSSLTGNFNLQNSNTIENDTINENQKNTNLMGNLSFNHQFVNSNSALTASLLVNRNMAKFAQLFSATPTIAYSKGFLQKKITLGSSLSYVYLRQNGEYFNSLIRPTLNLMFKLNRKSTLRLNSSYVLRRANEKQMNAGDFQELVTRIDLNYKF